MSLIASRRQRWRWALWAALGAGAGYASYKLYTSEECKRKRQQLSRLFAALFLLGDAAQQSAESMALVSSDLKSFLLSDDDELPRSLRQALKIAHSPDFQQSFTVVSAALTRGLVRGFSSPRPKSQPPRPSPSVDDPSCTDIKEICLINSIDSPDPQKGRIERIDRYTSGPRVITPAIYLDKSRHQSERKPSEELPDRLLSKLFSEPGVNFASTVVGNAAHNLVNALFDGFQNQSIARNKSRGEGDVAAGIFDVLCTHQGSELINGCIQTLVNTAVSVYIDKTKDVNFYNDMVAGITNPSHMEPMKDLLTTVCNGAVETLVKTSHGVMFAKKSGELDSNESQQGFSPCAGNGWQTDGGHIPCQAMSASSLDTVGILSGNPETSEKSPQQPSNINNFIEGVSKTLAIPSNHRLVVDVAGTMTSEAVRSVANVIVSTISNNLQHKVQSGWDRVKNGALEQVDAFRVQPLYKDAAVKAFFLASICLAVCLHMLTLVRIENV